MSRTIAPQAFGTAFRILVALSATLAFLVVTGPTASAAECIKEEPVQKPDGTIVYECVKWSEDGEPGDEGNDGGPVEPTCDLVAPATFCMGQTPCYYKENVVPFAPPKSKPPKKDSEWKVRMCRNSPFGGAFMGEAVWMDETQPQPPSLQEQAQTAFGQLQAPGAHLSFNPTTRTLVSLDTWFWADGLSGGELTGSSAFGLVAIASPDHLDLDPGDGSASLTCDWVTAQSDSCSYAYPRSSEANGTTSVDHGAYAANGQAVWDVRFEFNGNPVNIPGAPTELRGPQMNTPVRVVESQSLVTHVS